MPGGELHVFSPAATAASCVSGNFGRAVPVGLPAGYHFHDLRHTGNTIAAASGASPRELMNRLGQSSMRAALI